MPFSVRVRLDAVAESDDSGPEHVTGFLLGLTTRGPSEGHAKRKAKVPAKVEFVGRFTKTVRDKPAPEEFALGELSGELQLDSASFVTFACDAASLQELAKEPPGTTEEEEDETDDEDPEKPPRFGPRSLKVVFGNAFVGQEALDDKVPRLQLPEDVGEFRYLELFAKLTVDGAVEGEFEKNDILDVLIGPLSPPRLESTYALDLLVKAAQTIEENEFVAWASSVFGNDVPLGSYVLWRKDLLAGKFPAPEIVLKPSADVGDEHAAYDEKTRQIRVRKSLPRKAEKDRKEAAALFLVLLHEFGHHVDNLLRNRYSRVGGDAKTEEGAVFALAIAGMNQAEVGEVTYGTYERDGEKRDLVFAYPELHEAVRAYVSDPEKQAAAKKNNVEGFSAGKGRPDSNFFAHRSIEDGLGEADSQFFTQRVRDLVYFGNWERDYSQFCGSAVIRALQIGIGPFPSPAEKALPRGAITEYLDRKAKEEFANIQPTHVTPAQLGVYRAEEHVDNPQGLTDDRSVDPDFRGPVEARELAVDPATGIKNYIAHDGQGYATSTEYIRRSLTSAAAAGLTPEGMRLLGQALHTMEDLYAHSNFVELVLIRLGYPNIFPWVGWKSELTVRGDRRYPLVTGVFGSVDAMVSLVSSLAESLTPPVACEGKVFSKSSVEALTLMLNALANSSGPGMLPSVEPIHVNKDDVSKDLSAFTKTLCDAGEAVKSWTKIKLGVVLKATLSQLADFETDWFLNLPNSTRTDPTHSMLSKDHPDHPLHEIAADCARSAIKTVGLAMRDVWMGSRGAEEAVVIATGFFVHPNDIPLVSGEPRATLLQKIDVFAKANPGVIRNLAASGALDTFRKHSEQERHALNETADKMINHDEEGMRRALALMPELNPNIKTA